MSELLVFALIAAAATAAASLVPKVLARRRRAALSRGGEAAFRVRLAGGAAPYPQVPRRGVLRVGPQTLVWAARGGGPVLDLGPSGLHGLRSRLPGRGDRAGQDDMVMTAADGLGTPVRLIGRSEGLAQLDELLRDRPRPDAPRAPTVVRPGRTRPPLGWPAVLAGLGLLGGALTALLLATAVGVTGTVVTEGTEEDYCTVRWSDPRAGGAQRTNGVDCFEEEGDDVDLVALGGPWRGEVVYGEDPWFWGGASALLVLGGLGLAAWRIRDRRRDAAAPLPALDAPPAPPELRADQLAWEDVSAAVRTRARAEGWPFDVDPAAAERVEWAVRSPGRLLLAQVGLAVLPLLGGAAFGLLIGWTAFAGMSTLLGPTSAATAQVTDEYLEGPVPFASGDVEVTFPLAGGSATTLVAVRGWPDPAPTSLRVVYATADPDRARSLDHDGAPVGAAVGALPLVIGLGWTGWRLTRTALQRRQAKRALNGPSRRLRYVLVPDLDSEMVLLLWEGAATRPTRALTLVDDPRGRLSCAGTVELRGGKEPGDVVAAFVDGRPLLLASALLELDEQDALDVVNAVDDGDDARRSA